MHSGSSLLSSILASHSSCMSASETQEMGVPSSSITYIKKYRYVKINSGKPTELSLNMLHPRTVVSPLLIGHVNVHNCLLIIFQDDQSAFSTLDWVFNN